MLPTAESVVAKFGWPPTAARPIVLPDGVALLLLADEPGGPLSQRLSEDPEWTQALAGTIDLDLFVRRVAPPDGHKAGTRPQESDED